MDSLLKHILNNVNNNNYAIIDIYGDLGNLKEVGHPIDWHKWLTNRFFGDAILCSTFNNSQIKTILNNKEDQYFINKDIKIALIKIPDDIDTYLRRASGASRNKINKATKNGYTCSLFEYDEYLDDIYEINTSKKNRQGKPMSALYTRSSHHLRRGGKYKNAKYYGCFQGSKLVAYIMGVHLNELLVFNQFLGHKEHLKCGIMNKLIAFVVEKNIDNSTIKYINYLTMNPNDKHGTCAFKRHAGFKNYSCFFKISSHHGMPSNTL